MKNTVPFALWLFTLFVFTSSVGSTQTLDLQFENISIPQGLSNANVRHVFQDSYGFLWISTLDGLNRYDGYRFTAFKNIPGNPHSIIHNSTWRVAEDANANLWIATDRGAAFYDRTHNRFVNYNLADRYPEFDQEQIIQSVSVYVDAKDRVWLGTIDNAFRFDAQENHFLPVKQEAADSANAQVHVYFDFVQDSQGLLWAASFQYGLLLFDESRDLFRQADMDSTDRRRLVKDIVTHITIDSNDNIWVLTSNHVFKYKPHEQQLQHRLTFEQAPEWPNYVFGGLHEDRYGAIWVVQDRRGLFRFSADSQSFEEITFGGIQQSGLEENMLSSIEMDAFGNMWLGSATNGLFKYDPARRPFRLYRHDPDDNNSPSANRIYALAQSITNPNEIYVGTENGGWNAFNHSNNKVRRFQLSPDHPGSVRSLAPNQSGTVWLGLWGDGLIKWDPETDQRLPYFTDSTVTPHLANSFIRALEKDKDGTLWIGTTRGLYTLNADERQLISIPSVDNRMLSADFSSRLGQLINESEPVAAFSRVGDNEFRQKSFTINERGSFLLVNIGEGLTSFGPELVDFGWLTSASSDTVWSAEDLLSSFYFGGDLKNRITLSVLTLEAGEYTLYYKSDDSHSYPLFNAKAPSHSEWWGIHVLKINETFESIVEDQLQTKFANPTIPSSNIRALYADGDILWIGTDYQGLIKYNMISASFKAYKHDAAIPTSLSHNNVHFIHKDEGGHLWLATDGGLNHFDPATEIFTSYRQRDGLPTDYVVAILQDDAGDLWISSDNGVSRMNIDTESGHASFVNYDSQDGLQGYDYIAGVALKDENGRMYFGGMNGLNQFEPSGLNVQPPKLLFTDVKIENKSVLNMPNSPLQQSVHETSALQLSHDQNDISIEFTALHFSRPEKNQYAHFLQGYDSEWVYDNVRFATYTNLDPGDYTLRVRGANSDGVWSPEELALAIHIKPPWWRTFWAYALYGVAFFGLLFGVRQFEMNRKFKSAQLRESHLRADAAEAEARAVRAENERKTAELDQARKLQLSMLPKHVPELPNLEIAVYMNPATEVGGDYYDFHLSSDGTLTVAVGDATGHGLNAGMMVTATKSLFETLGGDIDTVTFMNRANHTIRQMRLETLKMAFTILKIKGNRLFASGAGMPSLLVYRKSTATLDEIKFEGMPLGSLATFPYEEKQTELLAGDKVILMSDGFPERQNPEGEMLGYPQAYETISTAASGSPQEVVEHLVQKGENWADGRPQDDDVTFVVIEVK